MLMEVLAKSTYTSLAVLSVAIMPANKPTLVKCLANISQIMRFTNCQINNPTGFTAIVSPDGVSPPCNWVTKIFSLLQLLASNTVLLVYHFTARGLVRLSLL